MAENAEGQEKSEEASGKRLQDARDRGQVSKSVDVTTAAVILIGGSSVFLLGGNLITQFKGFMSYILANSSTLVITDQNVFKYYPELLFFIGKLILPMLILIMVVVIASEVSQVGIHFASKKFTEFENYTKVFKLGAGLKRIFFSSQSIVELIKSIFKIFIVSFVFYSIISSRINEILSLAEKPFMEMGNFMVDLSKSLVLYAGLAYITIALSDFFYQRRKFRTEMKMTKQEVKEETKQMEGDPKIKSRIRALIRSRFRRMMINNVAKADVVITNPTHYAIALEYKTGQSNAPVVVAKGGDFIALQIREKAKEFNIPIVEDPPLARALFHNVEVDDEIPENMFKAVAQVLAYIYNLKK
ncbi:MAG: flagellar biosynthesis protein FlhB [Candidatus Kapabacteria bacterium]|nr:flagellar biosynthesis protein FlhB [Candidatus Kapabacteria bacterium]